MSEERAWEYGETEVLRELEADAREEDDEEDEDAAIWNALTRFVTWMYEEGPDPNAVPRQKLLAAYASYWDAAIAA